MNKETLQQALECFEEIILHNDQHVFTANKGAELLCAAIAQPEQTAVFPSGLVEILREAANIINAIDIAHAPANIRWPIVDELDGFSLMVAQPEQPAMNDVGMKALNCALEGFAQPAPTIGGEVTDAEVYDAQTCYHVGVSFSDTKDALTKFLSNRAAIEASQVPAGLIDYLRSRAAAGELGYTTLSEWADQLAATSAKPLQTDREVKSDLAHSIEVDSYTAEQAQFLRSIVKRISFVAEGDAKPPMFMGEPVTHHVSVLQELSIALITCSPSRHRAIEYAIAAIASQKGAS